MTFHVPGASHRPDTPKTKASISVILLAFLALMGAAMSPAGAAHGGLHGSGVLTNTYDTFCGFVFCGGPGDASTPLSMPTTFEPCVAYSDSDFQFVFTSGSIGSPAVTASPASPITAAVSVDTPAAGTPLAPTRYEGPSGTYANSAFGGTMPTQGCQMTLAGATISAASTSSVSFQQGLATVLPCDGSPDMAASVSSIKRAISGGSQLLTLGLSCPSGTTPATLTVTGQGVGGVDPPCVPIGMPLACPVASASIS